MIKLRKLSGATKSETIQINEALAALNSIWSSDTLKAAVLGHTKMNSEIGFESTSDTNLQVWEKMQKGDIELDDSVYSPTWRSRLAGNRVVGYEDQDGGIHQNRTFLDDASAAFIADNLAHETMHKMGYEHDYGSTPERPYSVPYGVGQIVSTILSKVVTASQLRAVIPAAKPTTKTRVSAPIPAMAVASSAEKDEGVDNE